MVSRISIVFVAILFGLPAIAASAQSLYELPKRGETRWASPENPTGAKGRAAEAQGGRKGSPTVEVRAGQSHVLAEVTGTSGTVHRIWMTFGDRSPKMLRSLKIEMFWDGPRLPL